MAAGSRGGGLVGSISDEPAPQTRGKPRGMAAGSCAFSDLARSCWGSGGFGGIAGGGGRGGAGGATAGDGPGGGVVGDCRGDMPAVELAPGRLAVITQIKKRQRDVPGQAVARGASSESIGHTSA